MNKLTKLFSLTAIIFALPSAAALTVLKLKISRNVI